MSYSPRYLRMLLALLVPIGITGMVQSQRSLDRDDCSDPDAFLDFSLLAENLEFSGIAEGRTPRVSGNVILGGTRFEVRAIRTRRISNALIAPDRLFTRAMDPDEIEEIVLGEGVDRIPVTIKTGNRQTTRRLVAYMYLHSGKAIRSPYRERLIEALDVLLLGATPVEVVAAFAEVHVSQYADARADVIEWLERVWFHYKETCRS